MHGDAFLAPFEIDAVVLGPIAEKPLPIALDGAKFFRVQMVEVIGQKLKLGEKLELHVFGQGGHLSRADFIEDDLEHEGFGVKERG
jgi:hypothetical protein